MVRMKPYMTAAHHSASKSMALPFRLTNACSVGLTADPDCVEKRELHRDVLFDVPNEYRDATHLTNVPDQRSKLSIGDVGFAAKAVARKCAPHSRC